MLRQRSQRLTQVQIQLPNLPLLRPNWQVTANRPQQKSLLWHMRMPAATGRLICSAAMLPALQIY